MISLQRTGPGRFRRSVRRAGRWLHEICRRL